MKELKEKILKEGMVIEKGEILKVDSFMDHQVDVGLMDRVADDIIDHLREVSLYDKIDKIVTIETSGIVVGTLMALKMDLPMVFARKKIPITLIEPLYSRKIVSPTKMNEVEIIISSRYLSPSDNVYIVDDFLATGATSLALMEIMATSGAKVVGMGAIIENSFLPGRDLLSEKYPDLDLYSSVRISNMDETGLIEFI